LVLGTINQYLGPREKDTKDTQNEDSIILQFKCTKFLEKPMLRQIIPRHRELRIAAIAVIGSDVFVLPDAGGEIAVYNSHSFIMAHKLIITDYMYLFTMVACQRNECLYISDVGKKSIYRYDPQRKIVCNKWNVGRRCGGLSVTQRYSVLVTLYDDKLLREYSSDGSLIREIILHSSMGGPQHCIQLSSNEYFVSHFIPGNDHSCTSKHGLCIVNNKGSILKSYSWFQGSGYGHYNQPCYMAMDKYDNVMIADRCNNRVQVLSPTLAHLGDVVMSGCELDNPYALHFDEQNHRLYIGEWTAGRLFVLSEAANNEDVKQLNTWY